MRKFTPLAALALLGAVALTGCNKEGEEAAKPAAQAVQQEVKMPADASNTASPGYLASPAGATASAAVVSGACSCERSTRASSA